MTRWFAVWRRRHGRRGEFGVVDGEVLLDSVDLNSEAVAGASEGPAVRNRDAIRVAIIGVVDLRGIAAESGFRVTHKAEQQAGLLIKVETQRRLAFVVADDQIGIVAVDFLSRNAP